MTENFKPSEAAIIAALAQKPFVEMIEGVPHVFTPNDIGAWACDKKEHLLDRPRRKTGTLVAHDIDSFTEMLKRHGSLATCNVYLDVDYAASKIKAVAIFNDHEDSVGKPGWRDFRAGFEPRFSEEWRRWTAVHKFQMDQIKFAEFLESNIADIVSPPGANLPTGADLLAFATQISETRKVRYGSGVNLQNGMVQIEFIEEGDGATRGKLELFREFAIGIAPFFNGFAYQIKAFLRYRIDRNSGAISFWIELQRHDRVLADAAQALIDRIRAQAGGAVFFGRPE